MHTSNSDWLNYPYCYSAFLNRWDNRVYQSGVDDPSPCKTVFDPSPAGFVVPRRSFASGFTTVVGSFDHGYRFMRNPSDTEGVLWQADGYWGVSGANMMDNYGCYWSCSRNECLRFSKPGNYGIQLNYICSTESALSVRPQKITW